MSTMSPPELERADGSVGILTLLPTATFVLLHGLLAARVGYLWEYFAHTLQLGPVVEATGVPERETRAMRSAPGEATPFWWASAIAGPRLPESRASGGRFTDINPRS